jgi:class 3 adenylate cyclase
MTVRNADFMPEKRIEFRVGIRLGDVVVQEDGDLMGNRVNIAARLEGIAEPGGICLSNAAYDPPRTHQRPPQRSRSAVTKRAAARKLRLPNTQPPLPTIRA